MRRGGRPKYTIWPLWSAGVPILWNCGVPAIAPARRSLLSATGVLSKYENKSGMRDLEHPEDCNCQYDGCRYTAVRHHDL
jgi:hypothetical protein